MVFVPEGQHDSSQRGRAWVERARPRGTVEGMVSSRGFLAGKFWAESFPKLVMEICDIVDKPI
jgi:hypothetical protein